MTAIPYEDDLAQEAEIVWLESTEHLDYVRQSLDKVNTRKGRPRYERDGRLVGYSNLFQRAPRKAGSSFFVRRTFFLLPHDRRFRADGSGPLYRVGSPLEAVDPRTVVAGEVGMKTPRSQARPPRG
ncbi:DUF6009 family protein [Streptomyces sp. NPDC006649]|uniref:DUF6009 family protein n=1 Tax=Streptomyces sp. NPDC006649 TaxID=3156896 RepID=UPI0033AA24F0